MNYSRSIIIGLSAAVSVGMCMIVFARQEQIAQLRLQRQWIPAAPTPAIPAQITEPATTEPAAAAPEASDTTSTLLRLRSEVGQLMDRKRKLAAVKAENEQLHTKIAARATNTAGGVAIPPGYIRRSEAQWSGMNAPQDTLQSFLWAIQNRDAANLQRLLTPEMQAQMTAQLNAAPDKFFEGSSQVLGMRLVSQWQLPDGSIEADVEFAPGAKQQMHFRQINGEWRMDVP